MKSMTVILSGAKNGANGMSDMDREAARVVASESGDERVQSPNVSGRTQLEMFRSAQHDRMKKSKSKTKR